MSDFAEVNPPNLPNFSYDVDQVVHPLVYNCSVDDKAHLFVYNNH